MDRLRFPVLIVCIGMVSCAAWAATARRVPLDELVRLSESIVYGRVIDVRSQWDPGTATIWTHTKLEVLDCLKGRVDSTVVVIEPGGVWNGRGEYFPGVPQFQAGQETVLFLYRAPGGRVRVMGLRQGVYNVVVDLLTGERRVQPVVRAPEAAYEDGSTASAARTVPVQREDSLSRFLSSIRQKASIR